VFYSNDSTLHYSHVKVISVNSSSMTFSLGPQHCKRTDSWNQTTELSCWLSLRHTHSLQMQPHTATGGNGLRQVRTQKTPFFDLKMTPNIMKYANMKSRKWGFLGPDLSQTITNVHSICGSSLQSSSIECPMMNWSHTRWLNKSTNFCCISHLPRTFMMYYKVNRM